MTGLLQNGRPIGHIQEFDIRDVRKPTNDFANGSSLQQETTDDGKAFITNS
jgi:hypothetical protein